MPPSDSIHSPIRTGPNTTGTEHEARTAGATRSSGPWGKITSPPDSRSTATTENGSFSSEKRRPLPISSSTMCSMGSEETSPLLDSTRVGATSRFQEMVAAICSIRSARMPEA